ncbi:MAG TPA: hypothetical protein VER58_15055 [Thermoanaerobaculia bacterium]|nr:hypothetical protein [Thermoanaerobaculia bacterium]
MKRVLLALLFAIVPTALLAQVADRDVLLTQDGTLYTVESVDNDGSVQGEASRYLTLTTQRGNERPKMAIVPDSLAAGVHWRPALAYDDDSRTLFVFWLKMPNGMSSELLLASYSNGKWQPALSIDSQAFRLRFNLRVAITRQVTQVQRNGSMILVPALLVHAVWWEQTGYSETARYALLPIEKGAVTTPDLHDLNEFAASQPLFPNVADPQFNAEILKHPAFVDNGTAESIDVIFGDTFLKAFNRVTLKPIADGRIHIPIGARPVGPRVPAPLSFAGDWNGRISTIPSPHSGKLVLYNTTSQSLNYIMYSAGTWSSVKTVALSDKLSADAAVAALSRMMNQ